MALKENFPTLDLTNYQRQGNISIDMCADCIIHERKHGKHVKALHLNRVYFAMLRQWVFENYGEEAAIADFYLDTVAIVQEPKKTDNPLRVEHWEYSFS